MTTITKLTLAAAIAALCIGPTNAQTANEPVAPSTIDKPANKKGPETSDPKTTGAMDKAVGSTATSADDVKRQTEGRPTAAEEAKGATATNPKPDMTEHSPGTVGAAPGTLTPMGEKKQ